MYNLEHKYLHKGYSLRDIRLIQNLRVYYFFWKYKLKKSVSVIGYCTYM